MVETTNPPANKRNPGAKEALSKDSEATRANEARRNIFDSPEKRDDKTFLLGLAGGPGHRI